MKCTYFRSASGSAYSLDAPWRPPYRPSSKLVDDSYLQRIPLTRRFIALARQIVTSIVLLQFASTSAADVLPDHDNGPLTGIFGFPQSTEGGETTGRGQHGWDTSLVIANHNIDEANGGEELRLDGETTRLAFTYRYGVSDKLDVGIEVPYLWHRPGSLDSIIDDWHDILPFVGGGPRANREQDQFAFFYADPRATSIDMTSAASGISDIRVLAGWRLSGSERHSTALRFSIKLPTGDSDELMGSGGTDISLGLAGDIVGLWGNEKLSGSYRVNATYLGEPDRLADRYKNLVGQLSFGLGYQLHQKVDLRIRSRIRSAVYDSEIDSLGGESLSLTFGADIHLSGRFRLVLSVAEDIKVGTVPDVSFQISVRSADQQ